jgi:hypothetical protein
MAQDGALLTTRGIATVSNSVALTVYKIDYSDVDGRPEVLFICLRRLVGERGFEPPTPWSRTRFQTLMEFTEFCWFQVIDMEPIAAWLLNSVDFC